MHFGFPHEVLHAMHSPMLGVEFLALHSDVECPLQCHALEVFLAISHTMHIVNLCHVRQTSRALL